MNKLLIFIIMIVIFAGIGCSSKPTIDSIHVKTFGWNLAENTKYSKTWVNNNQTAIVSIHFSDNYPDIPAKLTEIDKIRDYHRNMIVKQSNGGLLKCEVVNLKGYEVIEMITKRPNKQTGMTYSGFLTIPFKNYNFIVVMQATEAGITGTREAIIADKWMKKNGVPEIDSNGNILGWAKDPYYENYSEGTLMNYAENEEFDKDFPNHPLTIVRKKMEEIKESISFNDDLSRLEEF